MEQNSINSLNKSSPYKWQNGMCYFKDTSNNVIADGTNSSVSHY